NALLSDVVVEAPAVLADVPGQRNQQYESAIGQIVVKPVVGPGAVDDHRRLASAKIVREVLDFVRRQSSALGDRVNRVSQQLFLEQLEDGGDFGGLSVRELHLKDSGQYGIDAVELDVLLVGAHGPGSGN